jgi:hypothetical protein
MVGWTGEHSKHRPNHALYWASIQWAFEHGYKYFDFEGVDPVGARQILQGQKFPEAPCQSYDIIKYCYGGKVLLYPTTYDYVPNKMFDRVYRCISHTISGKSISNRLLEYLRKRQCGIIPFPAPEFRKPRRR